LAESRDTVLSDCQEIKPTIINGVPYFYQLLQRRLAAESDDESGGLRELLGGNMRMCCSGGAALPDHLFDYFQRQNLPLLQGYGLTESSPVITLCSPQQVRRGAVGKPIPGVEVRIAADGEILTRGPHVMVGYWQRPEATAEVIRDGWLHTGDLGHLDQDGFLYITGRKKELIVTSAGKNIAPVYLESLLTEDPLIAQALVIGDNRSYLTALIVPNPTNLEAEIRARKIRVFSKKAALVHPEVLKLYEAAMAHRLADVSHHEQVRNFTLPDRGFSVELGEMTPKFSLCRAVIEQRFAEQIEAMYRE
jgi:long-chain acyl-CoA synthetase